MIRATLFTVSLLGFLMLTDDSPIVTQALFALVAVVSGYPWLRAIVRGEFR